MRAFRKSCWQALHFCAKCAGWFALWTFWLVLIVLLGFEIWIAASRDLVVPRPFLHLLEKQLAASQLAVHFGRATCDPAGRLLLEDFSLTTTTINEPLVTGKLLYVRLDPWALLAGSFEAQRLEASGVECRIPAMFSPTGRTEALLRDIELSIRPDGGEIAIDHCTALVAGVVVAARGAVDTTVWRGNRRAAPPLSELFAKHYLPLARRLSDALPHLAPLDAARIHLVLVPSATRGAIVQARLLTDGVRLEQPFAVQTGPVAIATRVPLAGETAGMATFDADTAFVTTPHGAARDLRLRLRGVFRPATCAFDPRQIEVAAAAIDAAGLTVNAAAAHLEPGPLPALRGTAVARLGDTLAAAQGELDLGARRGLLHVDAQVTSAVAAVVGARLHRDLSALISLPTPARLDGDVVIDAGAKLGRASGWVEADGLTVRGVAINHVAGRVELHGTEFRATEAMLRQGENIARGSYTMDLTTRDFRFLLTGRLRPPGIDPWFKDWWPRFWGNFDFAAVVPTADVDVQGRWGEPRLSSVFAGVESRQPKVRGVAFDYVRMLLFYRINYLDVPDLLATRGAGEARGWFKRTYDPATAAWLAIDFNARSTIDLQEGARLFAPVGPRLVAPYQFEQPPRVQARGHLEGPGTPHGAHQQVHLEADATGAFALGGFPLSNLKVTVDLADTEVKLDPVHAEFAGGTVDGRARLWGAGPERRLGFDANLRQANLTEAIPLLERYGAQRKGLPLPAQSAFLERKGDIKLDLTLSAEGVFRDIYSFHGEGNAQLAGNELGQLHLLGALSVLFPVTSLRFTAATATFKLEGPRLSVPEVRVTGRNSAIDGHGTYALDTKTLDFNAKVFPFEESQGLRGAFGILLAPLSQFLEVKLTGRIDKPSWSFLLAPASILRTLAQPAEPASASAPPAPVPAASTPAQPAPMAPPTEPPPKS